MAYRVIQSGPKAGPLVVVHHLTAGSKGRPTFVDERVRAACGKDSTIVNYTARAKGAYQRIGAPGDGPDRLLSVPELLERYGGQGQSYAPAGRELVLAGFSAGSQAVRALSADVRWSALVSVDGAMSTDPPDVAAQIEPWRKAIALADAGGLHRVVHFTATEIQPPKGVRSVLATLADVVPDWRGKLRAGESIDRPLVFTAGRESKQAGFADVMAFCYPGATASAHEQQAQIALPRALNFALATRGVLEFNGPEFVALEKLIAEQGPAVAPPFSGGGVPPAERWRWWPLVGVGAATAAAAGLAWWLR